MANQKLLMVNFGFDKDSITERMCVETFVWIITMCMTHLTASSLMSLVVFQGWEGAGATGQLLFTLGVLVEVGFDMYDGPKLFLLSFFPETFDWLGAPIAKKTFLMVGVLHHFAVVSMAIPMNLNYVHIQQYHWMAFSLLCSAGICYISGHYKFTIDAKTPSGLAACKRIVFVQVVTNFLSRLIIYFPSMYYAMKHFYMNNDMTFFFCGGLGMTSMGLYNLAVLIDATLTGKKWYFKKLDDKKA